MLKYFCLIEIIGCVFKLILNNKSNSIAGVEIFTLKTKAKPIVIKKNFSNSSLTENGCSLNSLNTVKSIVIGFYLKVHLQNSFFSILKL